MMQHVKTGLALVLLTLIATGALAQTSRSAHQKFPRWVSVHGYWVVATSLQTPRDHLVSFYTNGNELIYQKKFLGVRLNPEKRSVKMKLKKELESAILVFERNNNKPGAPSNNGLAGVNDVP
jgi:hypothetical protein